MEEIEKISGLILKELRYEITEPERLELKLWLDRSESHRDFYAQLISEQGLRAEMEEFYAFKTNVWEKISKEVPELQPGAVSMFAKRSWKYAAAAVLLLLVGGFYLWRIKRSVTADVASHSRKQPMRQDVSPGGNRAILTLSDGSTVVLDSAHRGELIAQGGSRVVKLDSGRLAYSELHEKPVGSGYNTLATYYNTLATPRGGQYELVLADGTKVWLNAASSLRYPTAFTGKTREVDLTGEAYFEVAKAQNQPFIVKTGNMEVHVLGTQFDIMAYGDEPAVTTTLLEGAVNVVKGGVSKRMRPGQQVVAGPGDFTLLDKADVQEAVAWKNGYFEFHIADIGMVMRQLSRWYDVDVTYEGKRPEGHFEGEISRDNKLSDVLKMLEVNGVHFRIEGKRLIVL